MSHSKIALVALLFNVLWSCSVRLSTSEDSQISIAQQDTFLLESNRMCARGSICLRGGAPRRSAKWQMLSSSGSDDSEMIVLGEDTKEDVALKDVAADLNDPDAELQVHPYFCVQ